MYVGKGLGGVLPVAASQEHVQDQLGCVRSQARAEALPCLHAHL
ncbi:hypothetical protein OG558_08410 [Kribbella sp. NBC_01510]